MWWESGFSRWRSSTGLRVSRRTWRGGPSEARCRDVRKVQKWGQQGLGQGGMGSSTSQGGCFLPPSTLHEKLGSGPVRVCVRVWRQQKSHSVISAGHMWVDRTPEDGKYYAGWTTARAVLGQAANRQLTQQTSSVVIIALTSTSLHRHHHHCTDVDMVALVSLFHWRRHHCTDVIFVALTSSLSHRRRHHCTDIVFVTLTSSSSRWRRHHCTDVDIVAPTSSSSCWRHHQRADGIIVALTS